MVTVHQSWSLCRGMLKLQCSSHPPTYSKTIVDTFSVGEAILQVWAEDPVDGICYRLLSVTDSCIPFFLIDHWYSGVEEAIGQR